MRNYLILFVSLSVGFFSSAVWANQYVDVKLTCNLTGYEVSLALEGQPGSRILKTKYPGSIYYQIDRLVYLSDGPQRTFPISHRVLADLPLYDDSYRVLHDALRAPRSILIYTPHAQTSFDLELSDDLIYRLLENLGSQKASAIRQQDAKPALSIRQYYTEPRLWTSVKPKLHAGVLTFSGWYGARDLETCYQIDPAESNGSTDSAYDGLAFHVCGRCKVDLIQSSSDQFAPKRSENDPK